MGGIIQLNIYSGKLMIQEKQQEENIAQFFNTVSGDFTNGYSHNRDFIDRYNLWINYINKYFIFSENSLCIDYGCGDGIFGRYTAGKGAKVIGIDGSVEMLKLAKEKAENEGTIKNCNFINASLPLKNGKEYSEKADFIISSSVLEYIEDLESAVNQIFSFLKKDGVFLVSLPNKKAIYRYIERAFKNNLFKNSYLAYQKHQFSLKEAVNIFKMAGFKYIEHSYFAQPPFFYPRINHPFISTMLIIAFRK